MEQQQAPWGASRFGTFEDEGPDDQPGFDMPPQSQPGFQAQPQAAPAQATAQMQPQGYQASMPWQDPVLRGGGGPRARKLFSTILAAGIGALAGAWIGYRWAKKK